MARNLAAWVLVVAGALIAMITLHEVGHVVAARLLGDSTATFRLVYRGPDGSCIGCSFVDVTALGDDELLVVSGAGVAATQALAVAGIAVIGRVDASRPALRRAVVAVTGLCPLDAPYQAIQGFRTSIPPQQFPTQIDAVDFSHLLGTRIGTDPRVVTWSLVILAVGWTVGLLATLRYRWPR